MATKKVLIMIATDSETVEIVAPVDVLRRLDIEVTIASIHGKAPVRTTCGILITPDVDLADCDKDAYDAIIMPGGWEGYKNLQASELVGEFLRNQYNKGKLVASICMAANAFLTHKVGLGNKLTSYPMHTEALKAAYQYMEVDVVQDKNMITSRGPATVYAWAFKIAENLVDLEKVKEGARLHLFYNLYKFGNQKIWT